jgi:hypothetical protein
MNIRTSCLLIISIPATKHKLVLGEFCRGRWRHRKVFQTLTVSQFEKDAEGGQDYPSGICGRTGLDTWSMGPGSS